MFPFNLDFKDPQREKKFWHEESEEASRLTKRGLRFCGSAVFVYLFMDLAFTNYTLIRILTMGVIVSGCFTFSCFDKLLALGILQVLTPIAAFGVFVCSIFVGSSSNHAIDAVHFHILMTYCALYIIRSIKWSQWYIIVGATVFNSLQISQHDLDSRDNLRDKVIYNCVNLGIIVVLQLLLAVTYEKQRRGQFEERQRNFELGEDYKELFMQVPVGLILYKNNEEIESNKEVNRILYGDSHKDVEEGDDDQATTEDHYSRKDTSKLEYSMAETQNLLDSITQGSGETSQRLTEMANEMLANMKSSPRSSCGEFSYETPSGKVKKLEVVAKHIRWNEETKLLLTLKDVSVIKAAYNTVKDMDELKTKWLRTVSHEFKTPVNAIMGMLEILRESISTNSKEFEYLDTAQVAAELLLNYIGDLMDYFQIQTQNFQTNVKRFDTMGLILNSLRMLSLRARQANLLICTEFNNKRYYIGVNSVRVKDIPEDEDEDLDGIDFEGTEKLDLNMLRRQSLVSRNQDSSDSDPKRSSNDHSLEIYGDPNRVQQVLLNLVGNAIKFSPRNSRITVRVSRLANNQLVKIEVSDHGIGIQEADMNYLFKEFGRVRNEENQKVNPQGVGLGLWISKNLCQKMGGDLWVESDYGKGSTFSFTVESRQENFMDEDVMEGSTLLTSRFRQYSSIDDSPFSVNFNVESKSEHPRKPKGKDNSAMSSSRSGSVLGTASGVLMTTGENISPMPDTFTASGENHDFFGEWETARAFSNEEYLRILPEVKCPATDRGDYRNVSLSMGSSSSGRQSATRACSCPQILIVDDDAINRMILTTMLEKRGYSCACACDGEEAIDMIRTRGKGTCCQSFELVIMDYAMPYMNGPEATTILREDIREGKLPSTPIIGHTAYCAEDDLQFFRKSGVVDILPKPVKQQDLARLIAKWIK